MLFKLILVTSVMLLALPTPQHPPAAQYPAGVNPQDCPNFPICDNARLHNPQAHWGAPAPAWNHQPAPAWQPQAQSHWGASAPAWQHESAWHQPVAPAWNAAPAHAGAGGGNKFPAGVNPHSCPNCPFCDVNAGHQGGHIAAPPLPGWTEHLYPAGVSPHECPNFPYCH